MHIIPNCSCDSVTQKILPLQGLLVKYERRLAATLKEQKGVALACLIHRYISGIPKDLLGVIVFYPAEVPLGRFTKRPVDRVRPSRALVGCQFLVRQYPSTDGFQLGWRYRML